MAALKNSSLARLSAVIVLGVTGSAFVPAQAQLVTAAEDPSIAAPAIAVAGSTTAPSDQPHAATDSGRDEMRGGFRGQGWFGGGGPGGFGGGGHGGQPSLADIPDGGEWKQVGAFMVDHSPHRWAYYNRLPDGPRQQGMMRVATRSFRAVQKALSDDPRPRRSGRPTHRGGRRRVRRPDGHPSGPPQRRCRPCQVRSPAISPPRSAP